MFIATVHKAERKTVVESALVSSVIGIQSKGFSSNFLPLHGALESQFQRRLGVG